MTSPNIWDILGFQTIKLVLSITVAHVNGWQRSLLNVLRAWSKKIKGGLHADFPWELCFKWRWSLKYIGKLRTLFKKSAEWERSFWVCCALPAQFTLHLARTFLLGPPWIIPNDCGWHSTAYIKEISSHPIKIALHPLGTYGRVQRRHSGSNFNTSLQNILTVMPSLCWYSRFIWGC